MKDILWASIATLVLVGCLYHAHQEPIEPVPCEPDVPWQLSEQGRKNIGLQLGSVELRDFDRTFKVPAMVIGRPGHMVTVSALATGMVSHIYRYPGESVAPGEALFDLRLTHGDLVQAQNEFLRTVGQLDVVQREVARLEKVKAVAGKTLLGRRYVEQQYEATLRAHREALMLHGLSEEQVDTIESSRQLLQSLTVTAPSDFVEMDELLVHEGDHVIAGAALCTLVNPRELYVEGKAFEEDAESLRLAYREGWNVTADGMPDLKILYVGNRIDRESRALRFYLPLANELIWEGHFNIWEYRPGQRVQLHVPYVSLKQQLVVPRDAVVSSKAERFVFVPNGDQFDRKPVHVEHVNQKWAVIESDGTLFPGDTVVVSGAWQLGLALKSDGVVDPHAGHGH